jgi:hypothetical protein
MDTLQPWWVCVTSCPQLSMFVFSSETVWRTDLIPKAWSNDWYHVPNLIPDALILPRPHHATTSVGATCTGVCYYWQAHYCTTLVFPDSVHGIHAALQLSTTAMLLTSSEGTVEIHFRWGSSQLDYLAQILNITLQARGQLHEWQYHYTGVTASHGRKTASHGSKATASSEKCSIQMPIDVVGLVQMTVWSTSALSLWHNSTIVHWLPISELKLRPKPIPKGESRW